MAEEVSKTVKSVSDGTVTIAVEKYHELLAKAAEKVPVNTTVIHKTKEMVANDNKMWGAFFVFVGTALAGAGTIIHMVGKTQERKLV